MPSSAYQSQPIPNQSLMKYFIDAAKRLNYTSLHSTHWKAEIYSKNLKLSNKNIFIDGEHFEANLCFYRGTFPQPRLTGVRGGWEQEWVSDDFTAAAESILWSLKTLKTATTNMNPCVGPQTFQFSFPCRRGWKQAREGQRTKTSLSH